MTNRFYALFYCIIFSVAIFSCKPADQSGTLSQSKTNPESFRIMFYNVENYFDTEDDTTKRDHEFLPEGTRRWTSYRFYDKRNKIAKVIAAVGEWEFPAIVGICEIENRSVLKTLVKYSPLKKANYRIIHKESPDKRGIDVGLLYLKEKFKPYNYRAIEIQFPFNLDRKTRDILYVGGITSTKDTLHVFVNHWPSRWGGQLESEPSRLYVASVLRGAVDSLFAINKNANIVIMGDLNDYPDNKSLTDVLDAKGNYDTIVPNELYNLSVYLQENQDIGTHKHGTIWGVLDQVIVSGAMLQPTAQLRTSPQDFHIYRNDFLLEQDEQNIGIKPFRTYSGFRYLGGYSDHLPIYLNLFSNKK